MNYYLIIGNLKEDVTFDDKFKRILGEHLNYYENEVSLGNLILSGPKEGGGGIGIYRGDEVKDFCDNDPLYLENYIKYEIINFSPYAVNEKLLELFI